MKKVAVFDFDNTLIEGDSLMPFLTYACGFFPAYLAAFEAILGYGLLRLRNEGSDEFRTFVKDRMLHRLLKGKRRDQLVHAALRTHQWQKINEPIRNALLNHRNNGDIVVIASGSLDLYLNELLKDFPHDALICTNIGMENGVVTGCMTEGNCVRLTKAKRIKEWLDQNGPFEESFGYGNYPHDVPMLNLVKHRILVS